MTNPNLERILMARVDSLPEFSFSASHIELMEMLDNPGVSLPVVAERIQQDPELAEHLIPALRSAAVKGASDPQTALRMIGVQRVRSFIIGTLRHEQNAVDAKTIEVMQGNLLKHSHLVAYCAQLLATETEYHSPPLAFMAGLFHDIGEAILNAFAFEEISESLKLTQAQAIATHTAEDMRLGFNHAYFGAKVAAHWGCPPEIVEAVRWHHQPSQAPGNNQLVRIIHLADVAVHCQQTKLPLGIKLFPLDAGALAQSRLSKERLLELATKAAEFYAKLEGVEVGVS